MSAGKGKGRGSERLPPSRLARAALGWEAEFALFLDDAPARPEDVFGDPRGFVRAPMHHRVGTSYHLPPGAAVYFDTGVIELATPVIELERGAPVRAARALWEAIAFVRGELDAWEAAQGRRARLVGFSTHFNTSFGRPRPYAELTQLAWVLVHVLPAPLILLATNRRSTGVGVRPRRDRLEVTVDFTPSAALQIAAGTVASAIVAAVARWPRPSLRAVDARGIPRLRAFAPRPHTTRRGWLAHIESFPVNPFTTPPDAPVWELTTGERVSLRQWAARVVAHFARPVRALADPFTWRLIGAALRGRAPVLLDLPDRPAAYDDVGRACTWEDLFPPALLARSRYERVLRCALARAPLRLFGRRLRPVGMRGWSEVVFTDEAGRRWYVPLDTLVPQLPRWEAALPPSA